ncbi:hypothetical protein DFR70_102524 [Nocardia tenerifensis]|uniref:Zn-dependent peptidase ImmA (M78 family) n=1 Tax=Nocardia tenerifensis TaxID=228006 RepID=A0A318K659_9NOCA|nr:hypothetical protein [Nocardia tenerifensis]PXX68838.1 hypothetical protein DFR70_102524 [Nocardia tenerifensis]
MSRRARSDPALKHVRTLTASLEVPRPWHLATFVDQVATRLGKPIALSPQPDLTANGFPCGVVIERPDRFVVAYDAASSGYHTDHIVLHEIGHLLLDHAGYVSPHDRARTLTQLFADVDPAVVLRVLARTDYDDIMESQAELFASLVLSETDAPRAGSALGRAIFRR